MFDQKKFLNELPTFVAPLVEVLNSHSLKPILVGGSVRDYLDSGALGTDWDMELVSPTISWSQDYWKDLGSSLSKLGRVIYLPFDIIRLEVGLYQIELSPPRVESFISANHHKNFSATFDLNLPFSEAVLRRDFTINAMGILFRSLKEFELLDPVGGEQHLREKTLHPVSENFSKDPVRFLRAIRFKTKMNFSFSKKLEDTLLHMENLGFTPTYLWNEMQKSKHPLKFLQELLVLTAKKSIDLPLKSIPPDLKKHLADEHKHESWMIALEWVGGSAEEWQKYFSLSSESARRLGRWAQMTKKFEHIRPETFHGEFEDIREKEEFLLLFDWYFATKQILQKHSDLPILTMAQSLLPEWIYLFQFEALKDVKHIDPPLRAKYQVWNLCQRL